MLTPQQVAFFKDYGFLVFRGLLSNDEISNVGHEAAAAADEIYGNHPGGPQGRWIPLLGDGTPLCASLLEDSRFYGIAIETFDESVIGVNTDLLFWKGDTGWHRDLDVPGNTGLKIIYYLDPLEAANGALRVVPGTHIEPHETEVPEVEPLVIETDCNDYMDQVRELTVGPGDKMLSSVVVESNPGDVIAFEMPLLHASFGGAPYRRLGACVYWYPSPTSEQAEARRQEVRAIHSNHARMFEFPADEPYCHPDWIAAATDNPVRSRWIDCLKDLGWIPAGS